MAMSVMILASGSRGDFEILVVGQLCMMMVGFLMFVANAAGLFMCGTVPNTDGALKPLALAAAICYVTIIASPLTFVLFLLFIRAVGVEFKNHSLASNAVILLVVICCSPFGACLVFFLIGMVGRSAQSAGDAYALGRLVGTLMIAGVIALNSWYLMLLSNAQTTIQRARLKSRIGGAY